MRFAQIVTAACHQHQQQAWAMWEDASKRPLSIPERATKQNCLQSVHKWQSQDGCDIFEQLKDAKGLEAEITVPAAYSTSRLAIKFLADEVIILSNHKSPVGKHNLGQRGSLGLWECCTNHLLKSTAGQHMSFTDSWGTLAKNRVQPQIWPPDRSCVANKDHRF